jgi:ubiquinone/menaquinone biosynthesis C-methylase UbiE
LTDLSDHYGTADAVARVREHLEDSQLERLAALDQFHVGGAAATRRLAERCGFTKGAAILDVGSGLGGPARLLATEFGGDVTGIDLTPEFGVIAQALSAHVGCRDVTRFCAADALDLPFADGTFDVVWTEHVAMNIGARDVLYRELGRVVRTGGRMALYDVVAGPAREPLTYPVPWAREAGQSHLVDADALRWIVAAAGWDEISVTDESAAALEWLETARPPGGGGPSLRDVMGPDFPEMIANLRANFAAGRLGAVQAVFEKPS